MQRQKMVSTKEEAERFIKKQGLTWTRTMTGSLDSIIYIDGDKDVALFVRRERRVELF